MMSPEAIRAESKRAAQQAAKQFLDAVKGGFGYAIIEAGQFQVHIGVFKKQD